MSVKFLHSLVRYILASLSMDLYDFFLPEQLGTTLLEGGELPGQEWHTC